MRRRLLAAVMALTTLGTPTHAIVDVGAPAVDLDQPPWDESPGIPTLAFETNDGVLWGRVEVRPPTPIVGEPFIVRLTATDPRGRYLNGTFDVGGRLNNSRVILECAPRRPGDSAPPWPPSTWTHVTQAAIDLAGRHRLDAWFEAVGCRDRASTGASGWIDVVPGPVPANLRHAPQATVRETVNLQPGGYIGRMFLVEVDDDDGYLSTVRYDWGDGSAPTDLPELPTVPCPESPLRYLTGGHGQPTRTEHYHNYLAPGRWVLRVTVTTTSCDGDNPQTAEASTVVVMP